MSTLQEVLEDMQFKVTKDDPTDCNLPIAISVTASAKLMLSFTLTNDNKFFTSVEELVDYYKKEYL